jgi:hypothetical protein
MNDMFSRNNIKSLRIRTTAPINNTGTKKVWNGHSWLSKNNALKTSRRQAYNQTKEYKNLEREYNNLFNTIATYKKFNQVNLYIEPLEEKLLYLEKLLEKKGKVVEDSITYFLNIRNGTPITPKHQENTRKNRKSKTRR